MNLQKFVCALFILLTASLNLGFFVSAVGHASVHHPILLFAALLASLVATALAIRDRTQFAGLVLSSSLVVNVQLLAAVALWLHASLYPAGVLFEEAATRAFTLSGGALIANVVSVFTVIIESVWPED